MQPEGFALLRHPRGQFLQSVVRGVLHIADLDVCSLGCHMRPKTKYCVKALCCMTGSSIRYMADVTPIGKGYSLQLRIQNLQRH